MCGFRDPQTQRRSETVCVCGSEKEKKHNFGRDPGAGKRTVSSGKEVWTPSPADAVRKEHV